MMSPLVLRLPALSAKMPVAYTMVPKAGIFSSTENRSLELPQKPLGSFMLFKKDQGKQIKDQNPGMSVVDLSREIARLYKSLPEAKLNVSTILIKTFLRFLFLRFTLRLVFYRSIKLKMNGPRLSTRK